MHAGRRRVLSHSCNALRASFINTAAVGRNNEPTPPLKTKKTVVDQGFHLVSNCRNAATEYRLAAREFVAIVAVPLAPELSIWQQREGTSHPFDH